MDYSTLKRLLAALEDHGVRYAVFGAVALGLHGLDILTRLGTNFAFADPEIERVPFDGLTVSVASVRTLYRMKKETVCRNGINRAIRRFTGLWPESGTWAPG